MQNTSGVPRGALYILSGAAAIAIAFYSYTQFFHSQQKQAESSLHRSNAVRRRRRRWRDGVRPIDLDYEPTTRALAHLQQREALGQGYGTYSNRFQVTEDIRNAHDEGFFSLLPSKISLIRTALYEAHNLSDAASVHLLLHIQACFMQNFLNTEYPEGYIVGPDIHDLQTALSPYIASDLVRGLVTLWDRGGGIVEEHRPLMETLGQTAEGEPPQDPEQLAIALAAGSGRRTSGDDDENDHTVLDMLYRIAEEQAKRNGYQHRGVECNGCGMQPIHGIRYHCANCWDYDLCEVCESQQFHTKTHVFYKIRIPAPTRGQIKLVQPKWYPGYPNGCADLIPSTVRDQLLQTTSLDRQDLDALYDQFKCIASEKMSDDPAGVGMAICRLDFDRYFTTTAADRPPTPNVLHDRIYAFYDQDSDGLITFQEFAFGMAELAHNTTREARVQRLFKAFDGNRDGFVDRRDFLYLFRAHYDLNKELAHEMIYARDDAGLSDEEMLAVIHANNPISAAFGGNAFPSHSSRHGQGKHVDRYGDLVLDNENNDVLHEDSKMTGNRAEAIARQASDSRSALRARNNGGPQDDPVIGGFGMFRPPTNRRNLVRLPIGRGDEIGNRPVTGDEDAGEGQAATDSWHGDQVEQVDILEALGTPIPLEDIGNLTERQRVLEAQQLRLWRHLEDSNRELEQTAVHERWKRRQFYLDTEEGFTKPVGYHESDSSDEEILEADVPLKESKSSSRPTSLRSRSSSKVRFDVDDEVDTKSDVSSRNTPVNERWGGFEFAQPDRDVGIEIIYEAVQEAFNSILDHFFKDKEDKAMEAKATQKLRQQHAWLLRKYVAKLADDEQKREQMLVEADLERTNALLGASERVISPGKDTLAAATPDPMLPQNRPDEIDDSTLATWHQHELTEKDATDRGGYGRLNIAEFKRKLGNEKAHEIDVGGEGHDDNEHYWEEKADLGKFSFLSSWIEMASF